MPEFVYSDDIWEMASNVFEHCRNDISLLIPGVEIQHTGSTAIRGALTKGDVDIQARIERQDFAESREILGKHYPSHQQQLWTPSLALFHRDDKPLPVGIALVVVRSGYDEFNRLRDLLVESSDLLEEYNQLKRQHQESSDEEYRSAKATFFGPLGASHLLQ